MKHICSTSESVKSILGFNWIGEFKTEKGNRLYRGVISSYLQERGDRQSWPW